MKVRSGSVVIIAFNGPAGSGKDTAADFLVKNYRFRKVGFADPIKEMLNTLPGFNPRKWLDRVWKEKTSEYYGVSPRQMARSLGTEWARVHNGEDFWIKVLAAKLQAMHGCNRIVINDLRFVNEANWVRSTGGTILRVDREAVHYNLAHSSELPLPSDLVDMVVHNAEGDTQEMYNYLHGCVNFAVDKLRNHQF